MVSAMALEESSLHVLEIRLIGGENQWQTEMKMQIEA
jgi:hypothetical protein